MQQVIDGISEGAATGLLTGREYSAVWNALPQGTMATATRRLHQIAEDTQNPPSEEELLNRALGGR
jgi:hypothetical protein